MLDLRERAEASATPSSPSQLNDLGTFQARSGLVQRTVEEGFGEPMSLVSPAIDAYHHEGHPKTEGDDENVTLSQIAARDQMNS